jgi:mannose-6-phosphate isomerase-like protein (cupin superfamily)
MQPIVASCYEPSRNADGERASEETRYVSPRNVIIPKAGVVSIHVIRQEQLPRSNIAREFVGDDHGGVTITFLIVDAEPGQGPSLHRHPYDEVLILLEGNATLDDGNATLEAGVGDVIVIPAGQPHGFVNSGNGRLRQIDIHASSGFATEWLAGDLDGPRQ